MIFYLRNENGENIVECDLSLRYIRDLEDYVIECTSSIGIIPYSNKFANLLQHDGKLAKQFMVDMAQLQELQGFIDEHKKDDSRKERARLAHALREMFAELSEKYTLTFVED